LGLAAGAKDEVKISRAGGVGPSERHELVVVVVGKR